MNQCESIVLETLKNLAITYKRFEHPPVYTVEEAKALCKIKATGCKNLFLKDKKGENFFLIIIQDHKKANIRSISDQLDTTRLTFGNEEELLNILGLRAGGVSPFGLINDREKIVTVVVDNALEKCELVAFHPNVNTATLTLSYIDFEKYLKWTNHKVKKIKL